jgi:hypothetical protein
MTRPMEISSKKAVSRFRTVVPLQAEVIILISFACTPLLNIKLETSRPKVW